MLKTEFQLMALNTIRDAKDRCASAYTQEQRVIIIHKMGEELEELRLSWNKMTDENVSMASFKKGLHITE